MRNPLRHLKEATRPSATLEEAQKRCMRLYMEYMRNAPGIITKYTLDIPLGKF
jgi:hypothetical protein